MLLNGFQEGGAVWQLLKILCFRQKYGTLKLPLKGGEVLTQTQAADPYRKILFPTSIAPGGQLLKVFSPEASAKGGMPHDVD